MATLTFEADLSEDAIVGAMRGSGADDVEVHGSLTGRSLRRRRDLREAASGTESFTVVARVDGDAHALEGTRTAGVTTILLPGSLADHGFVVRLAIRTGGALADLGEVPDLGRDQVAACEALAALEKDLVEARRAATVGMADDFAASAHRLNPVTRAVHAVAAAKEALSMDATPRGAGEILVAVAPDGFVPLPELEGAVRQSRDRFMQALEDLASHAEPMLVPR